MLSRRLISARTASIRASNSLRSERKPSSICFWNGIDTPIHSIQALVNAIQTVVNSIQTSIDSIQAGFDMRQALAYVRELRRQPGLERGADRADSNLLSLFNALYRHAVSSLRKIDCSRKAFYFEPG